MMNKYKLILKTLVIASISLSIPIGCQTVGPTQLQTQVAEENPSVLDYVLPISNYFKTQSVQSEHQSLVDQLIQDFESDLIHDELDDYYEVPTFSIKLLSGSEGSYFSSEQDLSQVASTDAAYAQALVINADQSTQIFKGQFTNERFYFPGTNSLTSDNTTYLITLDESLQTQVYSGQLLAQSEGSFLTSPSNSAIDTNDLPLQDIPSEIITSASPIPTPTPSPTNNTAPLPTPEKTTTPTPSPEPSTSVETKLDPHVDPSEPKLPPKGDCPPPAPGNPPPRDGNCPPPPKGNCPPPAPGNPPPRDGNCPPPPKGDCPPPTPGNPPPRDGNCPPPPKDNCPPPAPGNPPPKDGNCPPPPKDDEQYRQRAEKFQKALQRHQQRFTPFSQQVKGMKLKPPPPPPRRRPPPPPKKN